MQLRVVKLASCEKGVERYRNNSFLTTQIVSIQLDRVELLSLERRLGRMNRMKGGSDREWVSERDNRKT